MVKSTVASTCLQMCIASPRLADLGTGDEKWSAIGRNMTEKLDEKVKFTPNSGNASYLNYCPRKKQVRRRCHATLSLVKPSLSLF